MAPNEIRCGIKKAWEVSDESIFNNDDKPVAS